MFRLLFGLVLLACPPVLAAAPVVHDLPELWRLGDDDDPDAFFGVVTDLCVDAAGRVYVADMQLHRIQVFDADGVFQRTIGREGDGPGEFRGPYRVFGLGDGIGVLSRRFGSVDRFAADGTSLGTVRVPEDPAGDPVTLRWAAACGDGLVACSRVGLSPRFVEPGERASVQRIHALDADLRETAAYHEERFTENDAEPVWEERSSALKNRWAVGPDGRVFVATSFEDYEITVYAPDGTLERVLTRDYDHRERSADEKRVVYDWATVNPDGALPGTRYDIEPRDKDVMALFARDDGTLWVLSSRGWYDRPAGSLGVFDVFDRDGAYAGQVDLRGDGDPERDRYEIHGDRLYVIRCFKAALATAVADGAETRFGDLCEKPMSISCYDLGGVP